MFKSLLNDQLKKTDSLEKIYAGMIKVQSLHIKIMDIVSPLQNELIKILDTVTLTEISELNDKIKMIADGCVVSDMRGHPQGWIFSPKYLKENIALAANELKERKKVAIENIKRMPLDKISLLENVTAGQNLIPPPKARTPKIKES